MQMQTQTPSGAGLYPHTKAPDGAVASSLPGGAFLYPYDGPSRHAVRP